LAREAYFAPYIRHDLCVKPRVRFALSICALFCFAVNVVVVSAQSRTWSLDYTREQASTSNRDISGTWTFDRLVAMWSRTDAGGGYIEIEHQERNGIDDVALQALWYRRVGDWTFSADGTVTPHANFLCRRAAGGEVSYRAVGTLVVSGALITSGSTRSSTSTSSSLRSPGTARAARRRRACMSRTMRPSDAHRRLFCFEPCMTSRRECA
jgi:hypothetical protein